MRLAVYCDYSYRRDNGTLWAEVAFARFLIALAPQFDRLVLVGRFDEQPGEWHHLVPPDVEFEPLPYYESLARPLEPARALLTSIGRFWRLLARVDAVWLLGPHPLALAFAGLAALRRRPVALGVRQNQTAYVRNRHPEARGLHAASALVDAAFRAVARRCSVVVVGSDIARQYRRARRLLPVSISLVSGREIAPAADGAPLSWDGELRVLSVGRLDAEKNPLLLADILAGLVAGGRPWRLLVCGEGPMRADLEARLDALGVREHADLLGYVPVEGGLLELYRSSHMLLHCSWTEGVPQVLYEAFAQRLPVVATAVGGVPEAAEGSAVLVPPGDAPAAVQALQALASDPALRRRLTEAGAARARDHSLETVTERVGRFLAEGLGGGVR
jgi:glycosyltransferase involved in cell wall biosynthesis